MTCKTRRRKKKNNEPIQYVPPEEKKTVVESPAREEPKEGKEGGEPERVRSMSVRYTIK
jgi:hypothetical protein